MRTLSVSSARDMLSSLLDDVLRKRETIIISRKGKPVAQLTPLPAATDQKEASAQFPLRKVTVAIADDFDEPDPELWGTLER